MADVFISYKREDRALASHFAELIRQQALSAFFDADIPVGDSWDQYIERELLASSAVVVLWSCRSVTSRWVRLEARNALQRGVLVPVLLEPCQLPLEFQDIQAASGVLDDEIERKKFLLHVRRLCDAVGQGEGQRIFPTARPAPVAASTDPYVSNLCYASAVCEALGELLFGGADEEIQLQIERTVSQLKRAVGLISGSSPAGDFDNVETIRENVWNAAVLISRGSPKQRIEARTLVDEAAADISYLIGYRTCYEDADDET